MPVDGFEDQRIFVWCEMAPRYFSYAQHLAGPGGSWEDYWKSDDADFVHCFGFDNGFYYAVFLPAMWMAYDPAPELPAAFVMNEFYRLDGLKFSTSRRHAIWGRELLADVPADVVRFYLAWTCPEAEGTNFTRDDFEETLRPRAAGAWQAWLAEAGRAGADESRRRGPLDRRLDRGAAPLLQPAGGSLPPRRPTAYEAATFSPQRAARVLSELVPRGAPLRQGRGEVAPRAQPGRGAAHRRGRSTCWRPRRWPSLAAPLCPDFAGRLWRELGFTEPPRWEERASWVPRGRRSEIWGNAISRTFANHCKRGSSRRPDRRGRFSPDSLRITRRRRRRHGDHDPDR